MSVKDRVFRTSSGELEAFAADAVAGRVLARPVALAAVLSGASGERPRLQVSAAGETATATGEAALEPARTAALSADKARRAIGALGGTPYELDDFSFAVEGRRVPRRRRPQGAAPRRPGRTRRAAPGGVAAGCARRRRRAPPRSARPPPRGPPPRRARRWRGRSSCCACAPVSRSYGLGRSTPPASTCVAKTIRARRRAAAALRRSGVQVRARSPEVLFDADEPWAQAIAAIAGMASTPAMWRPFVGRPGAPRVPLQGLELAGRRALSRRGALCSPELDARRCSRASPDASVEVLVFGREQVLVSRDTLGADRGPGRRPRRRPPAGGRAGVSLTLTDAKGYAFPVEVAAGETRIFNSRVTNLCGHTADLAAAGVGRRRRAGRHERRRTARLRPRRTRRTRRLRRARALHDRSPVSRHGLTWRSSPSRRQCQGDRYDVGASAPASR